jgi:hypothetical protein
MPIDDRTLRIRRIKRHVKAGASIVLALAAGAFLACQRTAARGPDHSPMGPDARGGPPPVDASAPDVSAPDVSAPDASAADGSDAGLAVVVADAGSGLARRDASHHPRRHHVDVDEHRRGLPVIDNLLE